MIKAVVAHPDTQHSLQAALALHEAGALRYLLTGFSLQRPAGVAAAMRLVAPRRFAQLSQHRAHRGLGREDVRVWPLAMLSRRRDALGWVARESFQWAAASAARSTQSALLAFNGGAARAFEAVKRDGLPTILDQSIAHARWRERVGAAEQQAFPEWSDTWDSWEQPPARMQDEVREAECADVVLCGSTFCAETMIAEGVAAHKVRVVEYGADTARFTPEVRAAQSGSVRLLFVGSMVLRKGIHYLLRAVQKLRGLPVSLTIVGARGVQESALLPFRDMFDHVPFTLHGGMPAIYRKHDVYVFPSLVEGSSLSIYEAMACGLPVITTPNAGSLVRDGVEGRLVPPRDVDALASAIEGLVRDGTTRTEMGRAARTRAEATGDWRHYRARCARVMLPLLGCPASDCEAVHL